MSDYITMQNRIAREAYFVTSAALSGKSQEIREAIQSAILFFESELFYFNEQQATTSTAVGFDFYATPTDYIQMFSLALLKGTNQWETLEPLSLDELEQQVSPSPGRPRAYCSLNMQFRLAPTPDAIYDLRLSYLKRLPTLALDADTNSWMVEAEPMIRAKAKAILLFDASHDMETAAQHDAVSSMWFQRLQKRTGQFIGTAQIRAQRF